MSRQYLGNEKLFEKLKNLFESFGFNKENQREGDIDRVLIASTLLQISEFRFFHLAYFQWYGCDIRDSSLEPIFSEYMFKNVVPHWVRHLARKVISRDVQGILDPKDFNLQRPIATPERRSSGVIYSLLLTVLLILFCILITGHVPPQ